MERNSVKYYKKDLSKNSYENKAMPIKVTMEDINVERKKLLKLLENELKEILLDELLSNVSKNDLKNYKGIKDYCLLLASLSILPKYVNEAFKTLSEVYDMRLQNSLLIDGMLKEQREKLSNVYDQGNDLKNIENDILYSLKKQNKYEYKTINTYLEIIIANSENILSNDLENMFKSIKKRYIMFIRRKNKNI